MRRRRKKGRLPVRVLGQQHLDKDCHYRYHSHCHRSRDTDAPSSCSQDSGSDFHMELGPADGR